VKLLLRWKNNKYYIFWVRVVRLRYLEHTHASLCHLWPVWFYNIFPHYLIKGTNWGEKSYWTCNVCFDFLCNFCLEHFSFSEEMSEIWSKMCIGLHVKYPLFLTDFRNLEFSGQIFEKYLKSIKFNENSSSGSRVVPCGRTYVQTCRY